MTLEELFRKLSYGELSNHAWSVEGSGAIRKDRQNQIVHFANEALKKLHARYALRKSDKILTMTGEEVVDPLEPDVITVLSVLTAYGQSLEFGTNPILDTVYVFNRELHVSAMPVNAEIQVEFQLRHPVLAPIVEPSDLTQEIILVEELHEALTAWIAHKVYGNMNTPEALSASANHRNRYEQVCVEAQQSGVLPDEMLPQNKFEQRGWI